MSVRKQWVAASLGLLLVAQAAIAEQYRRAGEALERGKALLDKDDLVGAVTAFSEAIKLDPKCADAYRRRGEVYGRWEFKRAIADYSDAIRLDPNFARTYHDRALLYAERGYYNKAISDYSDAIRLDPKFSDAYCNRGMVYMAKGDYDKAIVDFTEAIRLDPKNSTAYSKRGLIYGYRNEYSKAIADFNAASLATDQNMAMTCYRIGLEFMKLGADDKAIDAFTNAIRLNPKLAEGYYSRGMIHKKRGESGEAGADLAEAKKLQDGKGGIKTGGR